MRGTVIGGRGQIFGTTDGGQTWIDQSINTLADMRAVVFQGETGVIVGAFGYIFHSIDGGRNWNEASRGVLQEGLWEVSFSDDRYGVAVGDDGIILRTTDGGLTWNRQSTPTTQVLMGVDFNGPLLGIAAGNRVALRTNDGGENWNIIPGLESEYMNEVAFYGEGNVLIAGAGGKVYRSDDFGINWTDVSPTQGRQFHGIAFRNALNGLISGDGGTLFRTRDGGLTWTEEEPDTGNSLFDVAFTPSGTAIVVGSNGTIMRKFLGVTSASENRDASPRHFRLEQNYPNPFNPTTTIQYTLQKPQRVVLIITDLYGREVRRLLRGDLQEAGSHQVQFDAAGLPSGVYFYTLLTDGQRRTRDRVLLR